MLADDLEIKVKQESLLNLKKMDILQLKYAKLCEILIIVNALESSIAYRLD